MAASIAYTQKHPLVLDYDTELCVVWLFMLVLDYYMSHLGETFAGELEGFRFLKLHQETTGPLMVNTDVVSFPTQFGGVKNWQLPVNQQRVSQYRSCLC